MSLLVAKTKEQIKNCIKNAAVEVLKESGNEETVLPV